MLFVSESMRGIKSKMPGFANMETNIDHLMNVVENACY